MKKLSGVEEEVAQNPVDGSLKLTVCFQHDEIESS